MKVFCSWSGGKESALACYRAGLQGFEISFLLNMSGQSSHTHGLDSGLILAQSGSAGIPVIQRKTTWDAYEDKFKKAVAGLKERGIEGGVFGDIDIQGHRDWVERTCGELGVKPFEPLWQNDREKLLTEFVESGFRAIITVTKAELLGDEWLGRSIDRKFINDIKKVRGVDLCGEGGEYHTFVTDGPIFKKNIEIQKAAKILRNTKWGDYWFLDIEDFGIVEKYDGKSGG